ncbi:MAG: class C sortase [Vagococcus sp.]
MSKTNNKRKKKSTNKIKKITIVDAIFLIGILCGVMLLFYPFVSDSLNRHINQRSIQSYQKKSLKENKQAFEKLNKELNNKKAETSKFKDPFDVSKPKSVPTRKSETFYQKNTLGIIYIPKIHVTLPIYKSTEEVFLQRGAGLLEGTSAPDGGEGNHSVITGHRGLSKAKLFTDLPKLVSGDKFYIDINGERLAYEVFEENVVEPTETKHLKIKDDQDLVTLLTCTPYMINSHRLLVTGKRVPLDKSSAQKEINQSNRWNQFMLYLWLLVIILLIVLVLTVIYKKKKKREKEHRLKKSKRKRSRRTTNKN